MANQSPAPAAQVGNTNIDAEGENMTDEELQEAIKDAENDVRNLSRHMPSGPFPQHEVRRREIILLRPITLYKIAEARKQDNKESELLDTAIYGLMTSFVESYQ